MSNKSTPNKASSGKSEVESSNSLEKYLAFGFLASVVISIGSVLVILLSPLISSTWVPSGWGMVPILVMPFGFLCLIALLISSALNRKRSSRNN